MLTVNQKLFQKNQHSTVRMAVIQRNGQKDSMRCGRLNFKRNGLNITLAGKACQG